MSESAQFLIVRSDDLVVLGVQWSGFRPAPAAKPGSPPELEAQDDAARIVLTFPPQAVAEEKYTAPGDVVRRGARLAGPSRIEFTVRAGTRMPLDSKGVLAALLGSAQVVSGARGDEHTAIEMPWGLIVSAQARSGAAGVVSDHSADPVASPSGVLALWRARLHAGNVGAGDADVGLALLPLRVKPDEPNLDTAPLSFEDRKRILIESESQAHLADLRRFELSALGGSFSARAIWPTFAWDHDATLGRDQHVRVLAQGVLYPFGHRAELLVLTERIFDPPGPQSVAGLHRSRILVVTEPMRAAVDDPRLAREFPFSEVEILTRTFGDVGEFEPKHYPRTSFSLEAKRDDLSQRRQDLADLGLQVDEILASVPPEDFAAFASSALFGTQEAVRLVEVRATIADLSAQLGEIEAAQQAFNITQNIIDGLNVQIDRLLQTPVGPDGALDPEMLAQVADLEQQIRDLQANQPPPPAPGALQSLQAQLVQAQGEETVLVPVVRDQLAQLPRDVDALARFGDPSAERFVDLRDHIIPALQTDISTIEQIEGLPENQFAVFFWPQGPGANLVQFPVRCKGALGDLYFSLPLLFVRDISRDANLDLGFDAFISLTDGTVADDLAQAWQARAAVPLPGVRIDPLHSAPAPNVLPGDTHEVHEITLAGSPHAGTFRPQLTEFQVDLPALRALLPEQPERVALRLRQEFLDAGDRVDLALEPAKKIIVDFTGQPNLSGGLVAPKFDADAISRTLGPVAKGALPDVGMPDLSAVYRDATLLGFPLGRVIRLDAPEGLPKPPKMVPLLENGKPVGARMEWNNLTLKSHGPLRATSSTRLMLSVEKSLAKSEIKCTVSDFSLVLPPPGDEAAAPGPGQAQDGLLKLTFRSMVFTQALGRPPDLEVNGFGVEFLGGLALLKTLTDKLKPLLGLAGPKPTIAVAPAGITAGYALSLPSVTAGAFLLRNVAVRVAVDVPFTRKPVTVSLGFASRDNPFNLTVLMFGGGGYIDIQIAGDRLTRLEASMEFGAMIAVNFLIASGEVHALGGVHFLREPDGSISLEAFIRIGGSLEVLGLVSVSVELLVRLTYHSEGNKLVGHATLVIEVNLTLFAESVTLDSGEWELIGSDVSQDRPSAAPALDFLEVEDSGLEVWRQYRRAFVEEMQK